MIKDKKVFADLNNLGIYVRKGKIKTSDKNNDLKDFDASMLGDLEIEISKGAVRLFVRDSNDFIIDVKKILTYSITKNFGLYIEKADKKYKVLITNFLTKLQGYLRENTKELSTKNTKAILCEIVTHFVNNSFDIIKINSLCSSVNTVAIDCYTEEKEKFNFLFSLEEEKIFTNFNFKEHEKEFIETINITLKNKPKFKEIIYVSNNL